MSKSSREMWALLPIIIMVTALASPVMVVSSTQPPPENAMPLAPAPGPSSSATVLLAEDFSASWVLDSDGDYLAPPGWDVDSYSPSAIHWSQYDDAVTGFPTSNSTPFSAGLWWDPTYTQDEWLISPAMDLSAYSNTKLYLNSIYTMPSYGAGPNSHDFIKVSTDGGSSWDIIGDLCHDPQFEIPGATGGVGGAGWCWYEMWLPGQTWGPIDLSAYDGQPLVMFAFNYVIVNLSEDHGIWCVDDVQVTADSVIIDHIEVTPDTAVVRIGGTKQFTATAYNQFNDPIPEVDFIWTTDVGTVDATGLFTAQTTPAVGQVAVTNGTHTDYSDVTIVFSDFRSHHWKLDEVSGSTAYDSDSEDHGTVYGALINQSGKVARCYYFDGLDDYVEVPDNSTLDFIDGDDVAIFAWINTTDLNGRFLSKRLVPGDARGYLMQVQNGKFGAYLDFGATGAYIESSFNINDGLWHRVGLVRIGNVMECFVDGASIGTNPNGAGDISNSNPLLFGAEQSLTMHFDGYLDDIVFGFPPTADAGPDQSAAQYEIVTFDGSGSYDDGGITNYWWNFTDGGPVTLTGMNPTYAFTSEGMYNVVLTVMDTMGQVDFDGMFVTVTDGEPPVAVAGPDQADLPGATIFFNGSASYDPNHLGEPIDDGIVNWVWDFVDGVPVQYVGPTPSHTFVDSGVYVVTLTVTDQVGLTGTDIINVTINDVFDIDISQAAASDDWILVSFPNKIEGDPLSIFQDLDGDTTWDVAQWFDPTSPKGSEWKTAATFKPPALNDFTYVNNSMGFWIHITSYGDGIIKMVGELAESGENANLYLHPGWNLVGYPFATAQQSMWTFGSSFVVDTVNAYDPASPYRLRNFDWFMEMHRPGRGYFAHATGDEVLVITAP